MKRWISLAMTLCLLVLPFYGMPLAADAATSATYAVESLSFAAGYAATTDGEIDLSAVTAYDAHDLHDLRYTADATELSSASGIPYQVFDIDLAGRTNGSVAVSYTGSTKQGERVAVKAFNTKAQTWDTLGTFIGEGTVSASVDVASYNDNGRIHVAAMLDYVTNGSNRIIWSTDPQHYTKFEDLHEYYYTVYRYAAEQYKNGDAAYILTTGDLVDDVPGRSVTPHQWDVASEAMSYVEAVGMPNGLVSGNHDVGTFNALDYSAGAATVDYSMFAKTFPASRYENERWYGGSLNNNTSHYDLITVGNIDFLVMFLGYGVEATDETIVWANEVLRTYPHRTAIIATHQYMDALEAEYANRGQLIFDTIVDPNPNVKMVLCGHDDGSVCRETVASDGRIVYEVLADYQFVEMEDPSFYANEHYIGKVASCCGDGYIRLLTVEGDTLSSITYSPVTGRYNPYGVSENLSLDLNCGTPDRSMATATFGAAILGGTTTATDVDRMTVTTDGASTTYSAITYASIPAVPTATDATAWPQTTYGKAATPSEPYFAHAAKEAPLVKFKTDILQETNLGRHPTVSKTSHIGNYSLGLTVDLNTTPYLYYSFAQPSDSSFTFAFINNTETAPWITFLDARKGGTTMNYGAEAWDTAANAQYFTNSATGCIDMRTLLSVTDRSDWTVEQLNLYSALGKEVVFSYLFFGSEPLDAIGSSYGDAATPADPFARHAAKEAPVVAEKANLLHGVNLNENAIIYGSVNYGSNALDFQVDLEKTPYLYYSFAQSTNSRFTFALCNENTNNPWLTFLDNRMSGDGFNTGDANWNAAGGQQYFTDSVTGCIDMRQYQYDKSLQNWIVNQVNFYNPDNVPVMVNYLFFGSAAIGGKSPDAAALDALVAKANTVSTDGMTTETVNAFQSAYTAAVHTDRHDASAVARAYTALSDKLGALTPVKTTEVDTSNLVSVKNFHVSHSKWLCGSTLTAINSDTSYVSAKTVGSGMSLHRSAVSPHTYPNVLYNGDVTEFTVQPYGGIYLKLHLEAQTGWAIAMQVVQDGKDPVRVRLNEGIVNSNYNLNADGYYGVYNDVYDISEVFLRYGIDPTAPMTISGMSITTVGAGSGWNTFYHLELLTGKETAAYYYGLEDLIAYAEQHTSSLYTSASWSTMQSALTKAKTAMSTVGLTQPQINMAVYRLQTALDALEFSTFYEPQGSLLANDIGVWQTNNGLAKATRNGDGDTVIENTNGTWSSADYLFTKEQRVRVANTQLELNMGVADAANLILLVDGEWFSISKYLTTNVNGEDIQAGDYNIKVPLSNIFKGKDAVDIGGVRVWSVGELGSNAVTIRKMTLDARDTFTFDPSLTYGAAATPANPFMNHAAKNGPSVAHKVDVLAACGLDHPTMPGYASYGWQELRLIVDLTKTPYLYYSIAQPADSKATFALTNENTYAPYFTFLDNNLGGTTMATSVDIWNAYTDNSQYVAGSVTGCIDMRTLLKDSSATEWRVNAMTLYSLAGSDATMSYLYFGSAPLDDGYEEDVPTYEPGDFDLSGKVDTADARLMLFLIATDGFSDTSPVQIAAGDIDGDGRLSSSDVRLILDRAIQL